MIKYRSPWMRSSLGIVLLATWFFITSLSLAAPGTSGELDETRIRGDCYCGEGNVAPFCHEDTVCATAVACGAGPGFACPAGFTCLHNSLCDPANPPFNRNVCVPACPTKGCLVAGNFMTHPNGFPRCPALTTVGMIVMAGLLIPVAAIVVQRSRRIRATM
jgi:hypothetical protein